jgi:hypothetical protein
VRAAEREGLQNFGSEGPQPLGTERASQPGTEEPWSWSDPPPDPDPHAVLLLDDTARFGWKQLAMGVALVAAGFVTMVGSVMLLREPTTPASQPTGQAAPMIPTEPPVPAVSPPESSQLALVDSRTLPVAMTPTVAPVVPRPSPASALVARATPPQPRVARATQPARPAEVARRPRARTFVAAAPPPPVRPPALPRAAAPPAPAPAPDRAVATAPPVAAPPTAAAPSTAAAPPFTAAAAPTPNASPAPAAPPAPGAIVPPEAPSAAAVQPSPAQREADRRDAERSAIQLLLSRYRNAYNRLDASAASAVWPTVNQKTLAQAFDNIETQNVSFDECRIDVGGVAAEALCTGTARYVPKVGSRAPRAESRRWRFNLHKAGTGWVIDRVETR